MLWDHYVFRRSGGVNDLWDDLFKDRPANILYIAGRGFDVRAQSVMREFVESQTGPGRITASAKLVLMGFTGYELEDDIKALTEENATHLERLFRPLGSTENVTVAVDEELSASAALRLRIEAVLAHVDSQTDIVLDVSSLPRVAYLALLNGLLNRLVPSKLVQPDAPHPLYAGGVNLQVLVAEDAHLDGEIKAEDPSNELVQIPGFLGAMQAETVQDWPVVWFPLLGENRVAQLQKIEGLALIPPAAEVCPVVPHPSKDPRRADSLLAAYRTPLFDPRKTPTSNIIHVHESNPFEAYRQLLGAMRRYADSMQILGGCRLYVTPLGSKLITLGAGLACFEMRPPDSVAKYRVAMPHAEPKRYLASVDSLKQSVPEVSALVLTGLPYG